MGRASAEDINALIGSTEQAIGWHLQSNHYPPVPPIMNPVALAAIDAGNEQDFDRLIELPDGVEFRDGRTAVEAWRIIESFHLDTFIEYEEL